jgi:hypothetical protein
MNTPATQTPTLPLGPAILAAMQCAILDALPPRPDASEAQKDAQREGALDSLAALLPRNPVEATIASGTVAAYYAAMDRFRHAARGDLSVDLHLRTMGQAMTVKEIGWGRFGSAGFPSRCHNREFSKRHEVIAVERVDSLDTIGLHRRDDL